VTFREHLADPDALVEALRGFDIVVAMRERTPFPGSCSNGSPTSACS